MADNHLSSNLWKDAAYLKCYAGSGVINMIIGFIVIFSAMALEFSRIASNIAGYAVGSYWDFCFRRSSFFAATATLWRKAFVS